jgi:lipoprotein-releasing system permease protein
VHAPARRLRPIEAWQVLVADLEAMPGVGAVSPAAVGPAMAARGRAARAVTLLGVDLDRFARVIAIGPRVRRGAPRAGGDHVIVGTELADELGVDVGDRIDVTGVAERRASFAVPGVFDMGNADVNCRWAIVSSRGGQTLLDLPGGVSAVDVRLADPWQADDVADRGRARDGLTADGRTRTNARLTVAIRSQRGATLSIRLCVVLAVATGIAGVLVVSAVQKSKQVGVLRAMGVSRATVVRAFLWQGAAIGVAGALFGCGLGTALSLWSEGSNRASGGAPMYPIDLPASLYLASAAIALGTGLAAAALPSRRAARLAPAEAIRHE